MAEIARRYSKALLDIALEEGKLSDYMDQAAQLRKLLGDQRELMDILTHPQISTEEKLKLVRDLFTGSADETIIGFLCVIISKNRENQLLNILEDFVSLSQEKLGITVARVSAPVPVSEERLSRIADILSKKLGKQVAVECEEDVSLLGGMVVRVDGMAFDGSIKKYLTDLNKSLMNINLENVEGRSS